jgi:DUF917 family protein
MGFLAKIKQFFGMGTVSVALQTDEMFSTDDAVIKGTVVITGKSDQVIESVEVEFEEKYSTGSGDNKTTKEYELGKVKLAGFSIKAGETKNVEFSVPFTYAKSNNEAMAEKGGLVGGLGKVGKFMNSEKSDFWLTATVDIKGATFDPNAVKQLKRK